MALPPAVDRTLLTISQIYSTTVSPLLPTPIDTTIRHATSFVTTLLLPTLASGDLVSIAALLVILYLSLRTLDYLRRSLFGWIFFFIKLGLLALLVQVVFYINTYGWEKAMADAGWLGSMVWGVAEGWLEGDGGSGRNSGFGGKGKGAGGSGSWGSNNSGKQWGAGGRNRWT